MDFEMSEEELSRLVKEAVDSQIKSRKTNSTSQEEPSLFVDTLNKVFRLEDVW